jgi:hypothetical protein
MEEQDRRRSVCALYLGHPRAPKVVNFVFELKLEHEVDSGKYKYCGLGS